MSGFSNSRTAIDNVTKQYGSILRGYGPPVPKAGVIGDLYIDNFTFQLFEKRSTGGLDDWGHYLFVVPSIYINTLKWFGPSKPTNALGRPGDYYLQWAGYSNYGMQLSIFGPKSIDSWPENGETSGGGTPVITMNEDVHSLGIVGQGPDMTDVTPDTLIAVGLLADYNIPLTVTADPGEPVPPVGVQNTGQVVTVTINPLYTAEDEHAL